MCPKKWWRYTSKKLTFQDGSAIPLKEGDLFVPIVLNKFLEDLPTCKDSNCHIFLPYFFLSQLNVNASFSLKYGDQLLELELRDFDPHYRTTDYATLSNNQLIKQLESRLYPDGVGHASDPVSLEFGILSFKNFKKQLAERSTYRAPSLIKADEARAQEKEKTIADLKEQFAMGKIHTYTSIQVTRMKDSRDYKLVFSEDRSFNLRTELNNFAEKKISVESIDSESFNRPFFSRASLNSNRLCLTIPLPERA